MFDSPGHYTLTENDRLCALFQQQPQASAPVCCPDQALFWAAQEGDLPQEQTNDLIDHLAMCPACASEWRLALALRREQQQPKQSGRVVVFPFMRAMRWSLPLMSAAAVLVVAVFVGIPHQNAPTRDGLSDVAINLQADATLNRGDCLLRWDCPNAPEGSWYKVIVSVDDHLEPLVIKDNLAKTQWRIPQARLQGIRSGARLHWRVVIYLPDGGTEQGPTFSNRLR